MDKNNINNSSVESNESEVKNSSYSTIFKSTFLFGFVQIFNIIVKVCMQKAIALFLGVEGMGCLGLFNNTLALLKTGAGLGISQSAVREISEANNENKIKHFSRTIVATKRVVLFTGLLGLLLTVCFSSLISTITFGNSTYTIAYIFLSIAVFFTIVSEGQQAIITGMRKLRSLAITMILGAVSSIIISIPLYYYLGKEGIVPSLIVVSLSTFLISNYFVHRINYVPIEQSMKTTVRCATTMVKMGAALVSINFLSAIVSLILSSYIRKHGGLFDVGLYQTGVTIISGYFGIVITAFSTDYFPRISAINKDNIQLNIELNKQVEMCLVLICPLFVIFLFLLPLFLEVLYSKSFIASTPYIEYAIFATLLNICSNSLGMILIVKSRLKQYLLLGILYHLLFLISSVFLYQFYGLKGLGVASIISSSLNFVMLIFVNNKYWHIRFKERTILFFCIVFVLTLMSFSVNAIDNLYIRYLLGVILSFISILFTIRAMSICFGLNIIKYLKMKIK